MADCKLWFMKQDTQKKKRSHKERITTSDVERLAKSSSDQSRARLPSAAMCAAALQTVFACLAKMQTRPEETRRPEPTPDREAINQVEKQWAKTRHHLHFTWRE